MRNALPARLPGALATVLAGLVLAWAPAAAAGPAKKPAAAAAPAKKAAKAPGKVAAAPAAKAPVAKTVVAAPAGIEINLSIWRETLANGLRVVLNPDHSSPTVAVTVVYDVGSRNEERGRSGFAHLFEHMMFQGSRNVEKGGHFRLVSGHGGVLNGTTNADRTNYFEVLPSNELALGLWLEADRMKSLDISQANFENQRKVVQEEYRMRVSNAAYQPSAIRLEELVFQGYWPYEHSTIGSMADLDGAQLPWVADFFAHHYGPNNAVLVIAGDFDSNAAMALVHRFFDGAAQIAPKPFDAVPFPEQTSQRTATVRDDNARTPGVLYGWAIPPFGHPDHYALELAAALLGQGESSRLHQLLVRDKALAQDVSVGAERRRGPDLFSIDAELTEGAKLPDVEKLIEAEVKALATRGPSDAELEKAHHHAQTDLVLALQSNLARARRLGEFEAFYGDPGRINGDLGRYLAVTKDDIKRVAAQYLGATRRTIVETVPAEEAAKPKTTAAVTRPAGPAAPAKKAGGGSKPAPKAATAPKKKK